MSRPSSTAEPSARPPIVVIGVEQEWAARSLESVLGPGGVAVVRAYSGRQTLDLAEVAAPDVVVVDSRLPDIDGIDVCRALREERRIGAHVPVVLTTSGPAPRDFMRAAYAAGVWSVWEQPIDGELMLLRLQTWVDAKRVVDDAERVSLVDLESGLYTYRGLSRRAKEVLFDAARRQTPVTCIAISPMASRSGTPDDELPVSREIAVELGRIVSAEARGSDVVGRMGASDFVIVAPMTGSVGAAELVERIRDRLVTLPRTTGDRGARLTLRAGLAEASSRLLEARDGNDLLVQASTALRFAQSTRTNAVRTFAEVPTTFV